MLCKMILLRRYQYTSLYGTQKWCLYYLKPVQFFADIKILNLYERRHNILA